MSAPQREPRLFGKYSELVLLCLGFVLTYLVGGRLTEEAQTRLQARDQLNRARATRLQRAESVYEEVSKALDSRLFSARRVYWAVADSLASSELPGRYAEYLTTVTHWNKSLNRNYAMSETYLGRELRIALEQGLMPAFTSLHSNVVALRRKRLDAVGVTRLKAELDSLNIAVFEFNQRCVVQLESMN